MIKVYICKSYESAIEYAKDLENVVAVETEYGQNYFGIKDGAKVELLHHGENQHNAPAATSFYIQGLTKRYDNFIVSHIDADTIMGIMWAAGYLKATRLVKQLSTLIGEVDEKGFHWFIEHKYNKMSRTLQEKFLAIGTTISMWSFNKSDDISRDVHKLILKIKDIILFDVPDELIKRNIDMIERKQELLEDDFIQKYSVNHLLAVYSGNKYVLDGYYVNNMLYDIIIHYNCGSNSINIAVRDEMIAEYYFGEKGVVEPLEKFFGIDAGGRKSIGGSPRDQKFSKKYLNNFCNFIKKEYDLIRYKREGNC